MVVGAVGWEEQEEYCEKRQVKAKQNKPKNKTTVEENMASAWRRTNGGLLNDAESACVCVCVH